MLVVFGFVKLIFAKLKAEKICKIEIEHLRAFKRKTANFKALKYINKNLKNKC